LPFVRAYVEDLAANCSPASMAIMKRQVWQHWTAALDGAEQEAVRLMLESFGRPDFREGVMSFLEKRPPRFRRIGSWRAHGGAHGGHTPRHRADFRDPRSPRHLPRGGRHPAEARASRRRAPAAERQARDRGGERDTARRLVARARSAPARAGLAREPAA